MPQTRGVFGLILNRDGKSLLVSERDDGKGWDLLGGTRKENETDVDTLTREVFEESGLVIEAEERIGEELVFKDDTAVAYTCRIIGGDYKQTPESKQQVYVTKEDLQAGQVRTNLGGEVNGTWTPLKLVGPEGRLGRIGRMVYDGLSLMEDPVVGSNGVPPEMLPFEAVLVSDDKCFLVDETEEGQKKYRRLDPYSPTGYMQPN